MKNRMRYAFFDESGNPQFTDDIGKIPSKAKSQKRVTDPERKPVMKHVETVAGFEIYTRQQ